MSNQGISEDVTMNVDVITREEFQEQQANRIEKEVFDGEENAEKTASLIQQFVASYAQQKNQVSLENWLVTEFSKYPSIWLDAAEAQKAASDVIANVKRANEDKESLYADVERGKTKESWLAKRIEVGATAAGATTVGQYAQGIEETIRTANDGMLRTITNLDGSFSGSPNLDGFLAEQHHVDTFNQDAASRGSPYRAEVKGSNGENSVDIVIKDEHGKIVRRYQCKYGKDTDTTRNMFKNKYRGQRKLVPKGQAKDIEGANEIIEHEGSRSKPLSKEEAKELQRRAQKKHEAKQYEWNELNRIIIAKTIAKQAFIGAGIAAGMQGARILARRIWNSVCGKENPTPSEDLNEFFESSIKCGKHVGIQVAVSGAVVVAVKNGWLGSVLKNTPAARIANAVYVGMENAKILYKLAKGEISGPEAMDAMGNITCSTVGALWGAGIGFAQGAAIGTVLGPVGMAVGGFVGGVVGGMAGSKIGEAVYAGGKAIVKTAISTLATVCKGAVDAFRAVGQGLKLLFA